MSSDIDQTALPDLLVVEDDPGITRMLRFSLRSAGFNVTEVSSGADALGRLESGPVAAVVLDLGVPDGLGRAVLDRLRSQPESLPVWVAISSLDRHDVTTEYGPLAGHYLPKPFDPWELVKVLKSMLAEVPDHGAGGASVASIFDSITD